MMLLKKIYKYYKNNSFGGFIKLIYQYVIYRIIECFEKINLRPVFLYKLTITNSVKNNKLIWNNYNWNREGYEWGDQKMVDSIFENIIWKYSRNFNTILEIGPGAGRWSDKLIEICDNLILVDHSKICIDILKQKFSNNKKVNFVLNDGKKLTSVENDSIDFIWSFDVFVHLDETTTENYISEFSRVLKKNGIGIIHHPQNGCSAGGWRSDISSQQFLDMLSDHRFDLISQVNSWGNENQFNLKKHNDIISIFRKK